MGVSKRQRIYKAIMLVILTAVVTMIITASLMYKNTNKEENVKYVLVSDKQSGIGEDISYLKNIIDKYYLGEINEENLRDGALKGYVEGLGDEYSSYVSQSEFESFNENILGNYVGIGVYMAANRETKEIVILSTFKDSPAEKAGLLYGDVILKVDGVSYQGEENLINASTHIKGEEGTVVNLEIRRNEEILNFDITRGKIVINPVTSKLFDDNNIGYIQITSFDEHCADDFLKKYNELKSSGIKSLIIDIRNNGGGIVDEATKIADYIVPKDKTLMITVDKTGVEKSQISQNDPVVDVPVIILANENSASSSEILIGALQDNGVAKFVGTQTYGKGVIQEILKLKNGGALKLTTEEYYTPNKAKINLTGIKPDEAVELPEGVVTGYDIPIDDDTQLNKAIEMLKYE